MIDGTHIRGRKGKKKTRQMDFGSSWAAHSVPKEYDAVEEAYANSSPGQYGAVDYARERKRSYMKAEMAELAEAEAEAAMDRQAFRARKNASVYEQEEKAAAYRSGRAWFAVMHEVVDGAVDGYYRCGAPCYKMQPKHDGAECKHCGKQMEFVKCAGI